MKKIIGLSLFAVLAMVSCKKNESAESLKDYTKQHLKPTPSNNINISRPAVPPKGRIPNKIAFFNISRYLQVSEETRAVLILSWKSTEHALLAEL